MRQIALVAGEASGDASGGNLARELLSRCPDLTLWGAGGRRMREGGVDIRVDLSGGGAIGITQSLKLVPRLLLDYHRIKRQILKERPDLLILIDFGAFNVRLGRAARNAGIKTLYYFPPSSWRKTLKSTDSIKACADKVITPFPWSEKLLQAGEIDAVFLGHPLLDVVEPCLDRNQFCSRTNVKPDSKIVGLLPGSRNHEIRYNLPTLIEAAALIKGQIADVEFVVGAGSERAASSIGKMVKQSSVPISVVQGATYDVMAHSELLLTCSGTATLEAAIIGTPMVIIYRGGGVMVLEYFLRKTKVLESFIGLPNIIAERSVCPELIAESATPEAIAQEAVGILSDKSRAGKIRQELDSVRSILGQPGATARAAEVVIDMVGL